MVTALLIRRTHQVTLYRFTEGTTEDEFGNVASTWTPIEAAIEVNLQPLSGEVRQAAAGREVSATWQGFGASGLDIRADDGVEVTAVRGSGDSWAAAPANVPARFRVQGVGNQGPGWDVEFLLSDTAEAFA